MPYPSVACHGPHSVAHSVAHTEMGCRSDLTVVLLHAGPPSGSACCAGPQGIAVFPTVMLVWPNRHCVCRAPKLILHASHLRVVHQATAVSQATRCPLPYHCHRELLPRTFRISAGQPGLIAVPKDTQHTTIPGFAQQKL